MKIYVDMITGTYGDVDDVVTLSVNDWSDDEMAAFNELSDHDKITFIKSLSELR